MSSEAAKEAIYLKKFLFKLVGKCGAPILYNDNVRAQKLAVITVFHKRSKPIDMLMIGIIVLEYWCTSEI